MISRITDDRPRDRGVKQPGRFCQLLKAGFLRLLKSSSRYLGEEQVRPESFAKVYRDVKSLELLAEVELGGYVYFIVRGTKREPGTRQQLTPTEQLVAAHVTHRRTDKQVARAMGISHRTVGTHLRSIFKKWDLTSREELWGMDIPQPGRPERREKIGDSSVSGP